MEQKVVKKPTAQDPFNTIAPKELQINRKSCDVFPYSLTPTCTDPNIGEQVRVRQCVSLSPPQLPLARALSFARSLFLALALALALAPAPAPALARSLSVLLSPSSSLSPNPLVPTPG